MRSILIFLLFIGAVFHGTSPLTAQVSGRQKLERPDSRPELVVDLASHAKAKVFLPKKVYRLGEVVRIDVGLLFSNSTEYYFPSRFTYWLVVNSSTGRELRVKPVINVDYLSPTYARTAGTLLIDSTHLIFGCNAPALVDFRKRFALADLNDDTSLFEKSVFSVPADYCLDINRADVLDLRVEIINKSVIVPQAGDATRTLVGSVTSPAQRFRLR